MTGARKRRAFLLAVAAATVLAGILVAAGLRPPARAQAVSDLRPGRCSTATLSGTYVWFAHGEVPVRRNTKGSFAVAGIQVFNGRGRAHGLYSQSVSGRISRRVGFTATYTLNPDCTGTYIATDATRTVRHSDMYSLPSGSHVTFLATDPGVVLSGGAEARKIG